ncbi:MAG: hypothetical protein AAFO69_11615 [Bacteroidota bacterium]
MLKKSILNYKTKAALRKNAAKRGNLSFDEVKKIGIIHSFVDDKSVQAIYHFFDQLEKNGKAVSVLIIKDKNDSLNIPEFSLVDHQEMTQLGKWTNENVSKFVNDPFDYLIHLNMEASDLVDNILAESKARCRVGKYQELKKDYYELMISPEKDTIKKLIEQIFHYIQIL